MGVRVGTVRKQSGFFRKLIVLVAVCAAVAGIVAVTAPFLIDLNRYKGLITEKIAEATRKKVELRDIRLNLLGGVGIDVAGCTVTEPGGAGAELFSCEQLVVRLKVIPLLSKRIEVSKVEIRAPHICIVRDARGIFNFMPASAVPAAAAPRGKTVKKAAVSAEKPASGKTAQQKSLKGAKGAAAQKKPSAPAQAAQKPAAAVPPAVSAPSVRPAAKPFSVGVAYIEIVDGKISYRDETKKKPREVTVTDLSLLVKGIQEGGELKCKLSCTLNNAGRIKLQSAVGKIPAGFDFGGALESLKGSVDLSLKDCDLTGIIEIAGEYARDLPVLKGAFDADLAAKGSARELTLNASADLSRTECAYKDMFAKGKDVPCTAQFKGFIRKAGEVKVDAFSLVFGDSKLQVSGRAAWASPLKFAMTGSCDLALKDAGVLPAVKKFRPAGAVRLDFSAQTRGDGVALDALRSADREVLLKELGGVDLSVKCAVKDFDTGIITRVQKGPMQYKGPASLECDLRGSARDIRLAGRLSMDQASIEYPVLFSKPAGKSLVSNFNVTVKELKAVVVETLDVIFGSSKCKAAGTIKDLDTLDMDLKLASRVLMSDLSGIKDVKDYGFSGSLDAAIDVKGPVKGLRNLLLNGYIDIDRVKFKPPTLNRGDVEIDGALKINKDVFNLQELLIKIGTSHLTVNGTIKDLDTPTGTFQVTADRLNIDEFLQLMSAEKAAEKKQPRAAQAADAPQRVEKKTAAPRANGAASPDGGKVVKALPVEGTPPSVVSDEPAGQYLDRIDVKGSVSVKELLYQKNTIRDVTAGVSLGKGTFSVKDFSLKGYDGTVQGSVAYRMTGPAKVLDAAVAMKRVDINQVLSANTKLKDRIFGRLDLDLKLAGRGATADLIKKQMRGKGSVDIKEGKLVSIDILRNLSVLSGIVGLDLPNIDDTEFRKLGMTLDIQNGTCTTGDLAMVTDYFDMTGAGYFTFDALLDMNLNVLLTREFTARLGSGDLQQALVGEDGRMSLPFTVKGPLDKPGFSPNWGDILKRQAQYKLQKMIGDKLFKGKKEEAPAADAAQKEEIFVPASQEGGSAPQKKPSTKEILTDVLIDVLSESMQKEQKPAGAQ